MKRRNSYLNLLDWQVRHALKHDEIVVVVPMVPQPEKWRSLPPTTEPDYMWSPVGKNPFYNVKVIPDELKPHLPGTTVAGKETYSTSGLKKYHSTGNPSDHGGPLDPCCAYSADASYMCGKRVPPMSLAAGCHKWKSAQSMPRKYCRLWLTELETRAVRVWEIDESDLMCTGVWPDGEPYQGVGDLPSDRYETVWQPRYGKTHPWESNPWAWLTRFYVRVGAEQ